MANDKVDLRKINDVDIFSIQCLMIYVFGQTVI